MCAITTELPSSIDGDCTSLFNNNSNIYNCENRSMIDEKEVSVESFSNLKRGFLVQTTSRDRRKKLHEKIDI